MKEMKFKIINFTDKCEIFPNKYEMKNVEVPGFNWDFFQQCYHLGIELKRKL